MKKRRTAQSAFLNLRVVLPVLVCATACSIVAGTLLAFFRSEAPSTVSDRALTFAERVAYQQAIEEVYWHHRIWPRSRGERSDPKPSLDAVMSQAHWKKSRRLPSQIASAGRLLARPIAPSSCKPRWIGWQGTQNSRMSCANCFRPWERSLCYCGVLGEAGADWLVARTSRVRASRGIPSNVAGLQLLLLVLHFPRYRTQPEDALTIRG